MTRYFPGIFVAALLSFSTAFAQTDDDDDSKSGNKQMPSGIYMNENGQLPAARKYKVLAVAPMQFTENGVGLAVSYEHSIDKHGIVTYVLPAIATLNSTTSSFSNKRHQDPMFYLMPGLKFYPTSCYGKVKYALGPSLVIGAGQQRVDDYYYNNDQLYDKFLFGIMVNNSVNFTPTPHIYLGVEFGLGFTYLNRVNGVNDGITGLTQGGLKIGYRF